MEYRKLADMQIVKNGQIQELQEQPLTEVQQKMIHRINSNPNLGKVVKTPTWINPKLQNKLEGGFRAVFE